MFMTKTSPTLISSALTVISASISSTSAPDELTAISSNPSYFASPEYEMIISSPTASITASPFSNSAV